MGRILGLILVASIGLGGFLFGFEKGKNYEDYKVERVVDGDTLMVTNLRDNEEQRLRIWAINAPELSDCGGEEAKSELEKMVRVDSVDFVKIGTDSFGRLIAKVSVGGEDLARKLLKAGLVKIDDAAKEHIRAELKPDDQYLAILREAEAEGKATEKYVWSKACQKNSKRDPKCLIKGNYRDGRKQYYLESCSTYESVVVQEQAGDKWLCSEEQAKALGFVLAVSCR